MSLQGESTMYSQSTYALPFVNFNRAMVRETQPVSDSPVTATRDVQHKLARLVQLHSLRETLEREEEALKGEIKERMGESSLLVDGQGTPLVSYKTQVKTVLDTAKFKTAHPDLFAVYSRQTSARPFRIL